jgi:hypothetical protein
MIDNQDDHIPAPLIVFTTTALRHALLEGRMKTGVFPNASKLKLNGVKPEYSYYFNYKYDGGKNASCCGVHVINLPWQCRHLTMLDQYLEHTNRELPTEGVYQHLCYSQLSDPTGGETNASGVDEPGRSSCSQCYQS